MPRTQPSAHHATPTLDRGWAWMVVLAVFVDRFFTIGLTRSSGLFLLQLVERYHVTNTYAGMSFTLGLAIFAVGAPVATVAGESLTPRRVVIFGGLVGLAALSVSGLLVNLPTVVIMLGLALGVGNSCGYGNGLVMIGKHFLEKRSKATAIAMSGASFGQLVLPLVIEFLIESYGLGGALLISGALYSHCIVAGALMRPIDIRHHRHETRVYPVGEVSKDHEFNDHGDDYEDDYDEFDEDDDEIMNDVQHYTVVQKVKGNSGSCIPNKRTNTAYEIVTKGDNAKESNHRESRIQHPVLTEIKEEPSSTKQNHSKDRRASLPITRNVPPKLVIPEIIIQNEKNESFALPLTDEWNVLYGGNRVHSRLYSDSTTRRKSEDYSSNAANICLISNGRQSASRGAPTRRSSTNSAMSSLSASHASLFCSREYTTMEQSPNTPNLKGNKKERGSSKKQKTTKKTTTTTPAKCECGRKFKSFLNLVFDFSVLKNPLTLLYAVLSFVYYSVQFNYIFFLPGIIVEKEFADHKKALVIAIVGLGDLLARVGARLWPTGLSLECDRYKLQAITTILGGINFVLFIPATSFAQLALHCFLQGFFAGVNECLLPKVLVDFIGTSRMPHTLGIVLLIQGLAGAVGQPLLGSLKDVTASYFHLHIVCSIAMLLSCFILLLYPVVRRQTGTKNARHS